jgi:succinyl-CoA synthetase alpha subunit
MNAVRAAEEARGCRVVDVSAQKCGWDITSYAPAVDGKLPENRHIEVKGRIQGATTITVTKNEIFESWNQGSKYHLAIVLIGEIGGDSEEKAAAYIAKHVTKPVVAYVAGFTAPEGKTMGHAGAIVSGSAGTAQAKKEAFEAVGVKVGKTPSETAALMREVVKSL